MKSDLDNPTALQRIVNGPEMASGILENLDTIEAMDDKDGCELKLRVHESQFPYLREELEAIADGGT